MIKRLLIITLAVGALSGCVFGKTKYQCPAPTGAACMPVDALYALTDDPGRNGLEAATGLFSDAAVGTQVGMPGKGGHKVGETAPQVPLAARRSARITPQEGSVVPVRQAARVMRIWIAPWEDTEGNLHMAGRVFAEIAAPRWAVGSQARKKPKGFYPLQVEGSSSQTTGTVPGDGVVPPVGN